jgi:hypothetical protein
MQKYAKVHLTASSCTASRHLLVFVSFWCQNDVESKQLLILELLGIGNIEHGRKQDMVDMAFRSVIKRPDMARHGPNFSSVILCSGNEVINPSVGIQDAV